ncbi:hypothetical protein [Perlabentimonas gracilis]|uniref:hypothetical protein n=1 Tax=Perlabentimonas gracilis TaxID=2715279 RepID=UPI0014093915|nr:hypothetical protein [Perlabentimonas gracilis]NHB69751.1 hypothetical protein [Perlabentimonas gracilis]
MRILSISLFTLLAAGLLLPSCLKTDTNNSKVLATVYGKNLYFSEVEDMFPDNISKEDSLQIIMGYVDRWVRKQLLLNRAEKNLSENQKNVSKQLDDYRSSLLIFKYEQEFIRQKLDTVIPFDEIEEFYNENSSNFSLNEGIVKALFIKIRLDDPYYDRIKALYKSNKEEDIQNLDNMAYQVAIKYDYFNDRWIPFSRIIRELPEPINNPDHFLLRNRSIEMTDDKHAYLVNLRDVLAKGEQAPIDFEANSIRNIILNKRKQRLILDLETNIYNDARNHKNFEIYID